MWCIRCRNERAVAPTRYCAACLKLELEENEQDAEVLVISLPCEPEPTGFELHILVMQTCYPPCARTGAPTGLN